ncbi:hypothetical protein H4R19_006785, partial [Coemansia spiralis]
AKSPCERCGPIDGPPPDRSNERGGADMQWYASKCRAMDELTLKYATKCREYDQLLVRYRQLQNQQQEQEQRAVRPTSLTSRQRVPGKVATFDDFDEMERRMCPQYSGGRAKRPHAALAAAGPPAHIVTPSKRPRKAPSGIGKLHLLSSPPLAPGRTFGSGSAVQRRLNAMSPPAVQTAGIAAVADTAAPAAAAAATAAMAAVKQRAAAPKYSSQETQLDFSEADLRSDIGVELCPATDDEDEESAEARRQEAERVARVRAAELQQILEAIGDCAECRAFYTAPGLALPKRDATTLCKHRSKGKGRARTPSPGPVTPATGVAGRTVARPSSEQQQRRPST